MKKNKNILIYTDCIVYGGSERLMALIFKNINLLNDFNVTLAYRSHIKYNSEILKDLGIRNNIIPIRLMSNENLYFIIDEYFTNKYINFFIKIPLYFIEKIQLHSIFNIIQQFLLIKKINPILVHINNGGYPGSKSCNLFVFTLKLIRFKNIVYQINNEINSDITEIIYNKINYLSKSVKYFIVASSALKNDLNQRFAIPHEKIYKIYNTIDEQIRSVSKNIFKEYNVNLENDYIICSIGFLFKSKGHIYLLEALKNIKNNSPLIFDKIKIFIIGDGDQMNILKDYIKRNNLDDNIFLIGYKSEILDYIIPCKLFVFPSISNEDMPLVILTAMFHEKLIISTDLGGINEMITDNITGFLISSDINSIVSNLENKILYAYHNRRNDIEENAKKQYLIKFSNQIFGKSLSVLYNQVIC